MNNLTENDIEFLKELSHELNTQTNDYNADPVFWGIRDEVKSPPLADGYGDCYVIVDTDDYYEIYSSDGHTDNIDSFIRAMKNHEGSLQCDGKDMTEEEIEKSIRDNFIDCPYDFIVEHDLEEFYSEFNVNITYELVTNTGAFLTKRAALNHIELNRHHYKNPHTYAMTAFRNYEFGKLIEIIKKINNKEE